jgi:hypothetical protein
MGSGKRSVYQPRFSGACFLLHVGIALLRVLIRCREQEKRGAVFGVKIYSDLAGSQVKSRIRKSVYSMNGRIGTPQRFIQFSYSVQHGARTSSSGERTSLETLP